jgi:formate-dependent nitrite reductase cytochrome c552 subunit
VPEAKASVKAGKIECVQCHDLSKRQTIETLSSACTQCHDQTYAELLKGLRAETLEAQKKTRDLLVRVDKKLTDAKKAKRKVGEAGELFARGKKAYEFIAQAKGIHNLDLAGVILEQAQKDAKKAEELLGSTGERRGP